MSSQHPWYPGQSGGSSQSQPGSSYQPQWPSSTPPAEDSEERPLGDLVSDLTKSVQTLVKKEVELAKGELKEQASRAGKGGALVVAAGVLGFVALLLVSWAAAWGLAEGIPTWLAFLALGVLYGAIAGLLALTGKNKLQSVNPVPRQAVQTLKEDVETAKSSLSRGARY
jgi:hypothetical protein